MISIDARSGTYAGSLTNNQDERLQVKNTCYSRGLALLALTSLMLSFSSFMMSAETPWWHQSSLSLTNFTALPTVIDSTSYNAHWVFSERQTSNGFELGGAYVGDNSHLIVVTSESTTNPVFRRVGTNLTSHFSWYSQGYTTIAAIQWTNTFPEFFLGSGWGVCRIDSLSDQLETIWASGSDTAEVADLGNKAAVIVRMWGQTSGKWIISPTLGVQAVCNWTNCGGGKAGIWSDIAMQNFGGHTDPPYPNTVRKASETHSIYVKNQVYSTNGIDFIPLGLRSDNGEYITPTDFYVYSAPNIILVKTADTPTSFFIGELGGTFYPLNISDVGGVNTFYYSQHSRLLIVGNLDTVGLYSTVLPDPGQTLPVLSIRDGIVSWHISNADMMLQCATNISGPWVPVVANLVTNGDRIKASILTGKSAEFFQLSR